MNLFTGRNRRWVVPAGALTAALSIGAVVNLVPAHADTPNLPALTPAELLAKVRTAQVSTLSGTLELTSNLGLPSTGALSSSLGGSSTTSLATLVSGTHSADIAMDGPDHLRVTTAKPLAETNWVRNGNDLWSYDSDTLRATHAALSPTSSTDPAKPADGSTDPADPAEGPTPEQTPAQFAQYLLDQVTPSTTVTVDTPKYIDNRPVYELVLSPKVANSTIQDAVVSVDAATGVPLAVRIDATSGSNPAFQFGFTHVTFDKPDPSTFDFTPPPGATVVQAASPADLVNPPSGGAVHYRRFRAGVMKRHPMPADPNDPAAPPMVSGGQLVGGPVSLDPVQPGQQQKPTMLGEDWSTVAVLGSGSLPPQVMMLFNGAPTITVGTHEGRVLTTKLLNAILLDDGRLAVGALTPSALAAAVAAG